MENSRRRRRARDRGGLTDNLRYEGHEALSAGNGAEALAWSRARLRSGDPRHHDDGHERLGRREGVATARHRRADHHAHGAGEEADRVRGLELGAETRHQAVLDAELLARVQAVLRRPGARQKSQISASATCASAARPTCLQGGAELRMTRRNRPVVVSRRSPGRGDHARAAAGRRVGIRAVSDHAHGGHARAAPARKLEADPERPAWIETVHAQG